jgi:hypothetical protein
LPYERPACTPVRLLTMFSCSIRKTAVSLVINTAGRAFSRRASNVVPDRGQPRGNRGRASPRAFEPGRRNHLILGGPASGDGLGQQRPEPVEV